MARGNTNHSKTHSGARSGKNTSTQAHGRAGEERRWQRVAAIGTWLDSLARIIDVLSRLR